MSRSSTTLPAAATPLTVGPSTPAPARRRRRIPETSALIAVLALLMVFFGLKSPYFFNYDNFINILTAVAIIGIIAAPVTLLLVAGNFDLSVGSGMSFCGVIMAVVAEKQGVGAGVATALACGVAIGCLNGFFVTAVGVNPLITTLATLSVLSGAAKLLGGGETQSVAHFGWLGLTRPLADIPLPVYIFLGTALLTWATMRYTVYGRTMYAIGANPVAARLAGIRSKRMIFIGFVLTGLAVAVAALINASQLSAAPNTAGLGLELSVITAVILGGASLAGGRGTMLGTLLGLLIIGVVNNGLTLLNVDAFWQEVARGALLLLAVSFDQLRLRVAGDGMT